MLPQWFLSGFLRHKFDFRDTGTTVCALIIEMVHSSIIRQVFFSNFLFNFLNMPHFFFLQQTDITVSSRQPPLTKGPEKCGRPPKYQDEDECKDAQNAQHWARYWFKLRLSVIEC